MSFRKAARERRLASVWASYQNRIAAICCAAGLALAGCVAEKPVPCAGDHGGISLPEGFCATVFADTLGRARHLTVRDNGDVYVALRRQMDGFGIVALRDADGDGVAEQKERFGDIRGTGIGIQGNYLYFGADTHLVRFPLKAGQLVPTTDPETIISGFLRQRQHAAKPFTFDMSGNIFVDVGAPSNACQEQMRTPGSPGLDPCPQLDRQAGIWRFSADQPGQTQETHGHRFATGIRHAVALDWNPVSRRLYAMQHGRDQLDQLWPDTFTAEQNAELPSEEFLLIGDGDDFGWPYCYYDHIQGRKMLAPEYGGDGNASGRCAGAVQPILTFPGHWAPNDLHFYRGQQFPVQYRGGAFIAFHGSWNRAPLEQQGYKVVYVPFSGENPSGQWSDFATGFAGPGRIMSSRDAVYRPMGLAEGPDGALYISDSVKGRIWKVLYSGAHGG